MHLISIFNNWLGHKKYGDEIALALIGPGGEMRMKAAGIQNIDKDKVPSRIAARGGLGAVMGSKNIKAIDVRGKGRVEVADNEKLSSLIKSVIK